MSSHYDLPDLLEHWHRGRLSSDETLDLVCQWLEKEKLAKGFEAMKQDRASGMKGMHPLATTRLFSSLSPRFTKILFRLGFCFACENPLTIGEVSQAEGHVVVSFVCETCGEEREESELEVISYETLEDPDEWEVFKGSEIEMVFE